MANNAYQDIHLTKHVHCWCGTDVTNKKTLGPHTLTYNHEKY